MDAVNITKDETSQTLAENKDGQTSGQLRGGTHKSSHREVIHMLVDVHRSFESAQPGDIHLPLEAQSNKPVFVSKLSLTRRRAAKLLTAKNNHNENIVQHRALSSVENIPIQPNTLGFDTKLPLTKALHDKVLKAPSNRTYDFEPASTSSSKDTRAQLSSFANIKIQSHTSALGSSKVVGESVSKAPTQQATMQQNSDNLYVCRTPSVKPSVSHVSKPVEVTTKKPRFGHSIANTNTALLNKAAKKQSFNNHNWYTWYTHQTDFWHKLQGTIKNIIIDVTALLALPSENELLSKVTELSEKLYNVNKAFRRGVERLPQTIVDNAHSLLNSFVPTPLPTNNAHDTVKWLLAQCSVCWGLRSVIDSVLNEFQCLLSMSDERMRSVMASKLKTRYNAVSNVFRCGLRCMIGKGLKTKSVRYLQHKKNVKYRSKAVKKAINTLRSLRRTVPVKRRHCKPYCSVSGSRIASTVNHNVNPDTVMPGSSSTVPAEEIMRSHIQYSPVVHQNAISNTPNEISVQNEAHDQNNGLEASVYLEHINRFQKSRDKFNVLEYYEHFRFVNLEKMPSFKDAVHSVHGAIQGLLDGMMSDIGHHDLIQLRLDGDGLSNPLYSIKRSKDSLNAESFLNDVSKLLQSNAELLGNGTLRLVVSIVKNRVGGVLSRRRVRSTPYSRIIEKALAF
eukprot:XP_012825037.1 PREDICTED: uncharacterized protein LOC101733467 isoform X2 [Xenopus tropicalis]